MKCEKTKFDFGDVRQQRWRLKKMRMCVSVGVCVCERESVCREGGSGKYLRCDVDRKGQEG